MNDSIFFKRYEYTLGKRDRPFEDLYNEYLQERYGNDISSERKRIVGLFKAFDALLKREYFHLNSKLVGDSSGFIQMDKFINKKTNVVEFSFDIMKDIEDRMCVFENKSDLSSFTNAVADHVEKTFDDLSEEIHTAFIKCFESVCNHVLEDYDVYMINNDSLFMVTFKPKDSRKLTFRFVPRTRLPGAPAALFPHIEGTGLYH